MRYRIAALVGVLGIVAATALAAATPVTPPPGAFVKTAVPTYKLAHSRSVDVRGIDSAATANARPLAAG